MSDKQTVTLEYPGREAVGVGFDAWRQVLETVATHAAAHPRFVTMQFLMGVMGDTEAPRHERIQAASLLAEMTK